MKRYGLTILLYLLVSSAQADWKDSINDAWDNTRDLSDNTINKTKDFIDTLTGDVRLLRGDEVQIISREEVAAEQENQLKQIWPEVLENLDDALSINMKIDKAPDSSWFSEDKDSLRKDQFDVFSEIEALLSSPEISLNREHIGKLKDKIYKERQGIARLKEKRIVASAEERGKLESKIQTLQNNIAVYEKTINYEKANLKIRLQELGLLLSHDQIDVLLSRVDSDDIIKMSVVYDVLADITRQLMELTQEFNEDITQARKYYGMHVVLLKFVINMQQTYINKLEQEYLPKIDKIKDETIRISQETRTLLRSKNKTAQRKALQNNLKAQALTLKVAKLYVQQLNKQKAKVVEALKLAKSDYRVAKNTFDTVKLSAELIRLMKTNQASFNALMNIQIPEIVPFKNLEMQKKFEELSILLKNQ